MDPVQALQDLPAQSLGMSEKGGPTAVTAGKQIRYRYGIAGIKGRGLGNIADYRLAAPLSGGRKDDGAGIILLTQDGFDKGAFTGTIGSDQRQQLAAMDVQIHILKDAVRTDTDLQIFHL
jgi:hypothetical protein